MSKDLLAQLIQTFEPEYKAALPKTPESKAWDAEDWETHFHERAAFAEYESGASRAEAEQQAIRECVDHWLRSNPDPHADPDKCPCCHTVSGITSAIPSISYANPGGLILNIHSHCLEGWTERRRQQAVEALAAMGIMERN